MRRHLPAGLRRAALGEVLRRQRNQVVGLRDALRQQEPQLVAANRAADHGVDVVGVVERIAGRDVRLQLVGDVVVLHRAVPAEDAQDPRERVSALLGDRVHAYAADGGLGRLGTRVVDQLLLREFVDADAVALLPALRQVLPDVHSVEVDVLILAQRSVNRHVAREALAVERDARHEARAALHRSRRGEDVERFTIDDRLVLRALKVDDGRRAGHSHRLLDGADRERCVHLRGECAFDHDALTLERLEAGQRERDRISAGPQIDDGIAAGAVADGRAHLLDEHGT